MSITGAIVAGAAAGTAVNGFIFNYSKTQYEAKITALQGYVNTLSGHLGKLETLRDGIENFWNDANARETYKALNSTITQVKRTMTTANNLITKYQAIVTNLDGSKEAVQGLVSDAMGLLDGLATE